MSLSAGLAHESAPSLDSSLIPDGSRQSAGLSTMLGGSADFAHRQGRTRLFGTTSGWLRRDQLDRFSTVSYSGEFGASIRLPNRADLQITQTADYSPSYVYGLFPTAPPLAPTGASPAEPDYVIDQNPSYLYRTRAALGFGSLYGTRVTTTVEYHYTDFNRSPEANSGVRSYGSYLAGVTASRELSRRGGVSAGYHVRSGEFGVGGRAATHQFTIGAHYTPPLSQTRKLTLSLNVSPSMVRQSTTAMAPTDAVGSDVPDEAATSVVGSWQYPLQWDARIDYPFRPKWRASLSYRRSLEYMEGLTEPLITSGTWADLTGVIGRRTDVFASAGYANGQSALSGNTTDLGTYTGRVGVTYTLTRAIALFSEFLYYYYNDPGGQAHLASGTYEQRRIFVGVTFSARPFGR